MVARRARCKVTSPAGGRAGPAQLPRRRSRRRRALQTKPAPKTPGTPTWSDSACCAPRCARDSWRREDPCQEQVLPAALSHARREGEQNSRTGGPKPNFSKLNYSRISELFSLLSEHISTVVREGRILEFSSRSSFFFLSAVGFCSASLTSRLCTFNLERPGGSTSRGRAEPRAIGGRYGRQEAGGAEDGRVAQGAHARRHHTHPRAGGPGPRPPRRARA